MVHTENVFGEKNSNIKKKKKAKKNFKSMESKESNFIIVSIFEKKN